MRLPQRRALLCRAQGQENGTRHCPQQVRTGLRQPLGALSHATLNRSEAKSPGRGPAARATFPAYQAKTALP